MNKIQDIERPIVLQAQKSKLLDEGEAVWDIICKAVDPRQKAATTHEDIERFFDFIADKRTLWVQNIKDCKMAMEADWGDEIVVTRSW